MPKIKNVYRSISKVSGKIDEILSNPIIYSHSELGENMRKFKRLIRNNTLDIDDNELWFESLVRRFKRDFHRVQSPSENLFLAYHKKFVFILQKCDIKDIVAKYATVIYLYKLIARRQVLPHSVIIKRLEILYLLKSNLT